MLVNLVQDCALCPRVTVVLKRLGSFQWVIELLDSLPDGQQAVLVSVLPFNDVVSIENLLDDCFKVLLLQIGKDV